MATTARLEPAIILNSNGVAPVLASSIRYTVQILDSGAVLENQITRHAVDDQTKVIPAKPGDPALVWCYGDKCFIYPLGEVVSFLECPENP